jgi:hypothetical protein
MSHSQLKWGRAGHARMSIRAASCMLLSPHAATPEYRALERAWRQRQGKEGAEGKGARRRVADEANEKAAACTPSAGSLVPILFLFK